MMDIYTYMCIYICMHISICIYRVNPRRYSSNIVREITSIVNGPRYATMWMGGGEMGSVQP